MTERRKPKIQLGRRRTDVPIKVLEDFKDEITVHLREVVEKTVNGKIKTLQETVLTKEDFSKYVTLDTKWKEDQENYRKESTDPVVKTYNQTSDAWTVLIAVLKFLGILGAAIVAWGFIKTKLLS